MISINPSGTPIAVVGDAGSSATARSLHEAYSLGQALVTEGFTVLTGGMGGVMEAACRGAKSSDCYQRGSTIGILPQAHPFQANPFVDIALPSGLGYGRNFLVACGYAVIGIGGGAGTLSELALAWKNGRLVIALRGDGWSGELADRPLDGRTRFNSIQGDKVYAADNANHAVEILKKQLPIYLEAARQSFHTNHIEKHNEN